MPSGSNASRKTARRAGKQVHGDEIAAGGKSMKRVKRGAESSAESRQEGPVNKKRFVGVRQRPSGRWVAEIKDTTQKIRLWLGTFDSAEEGAKAYDSAARALRGANTRTNFVAAIASSCEATVPTKAARLIRLRQTAAAASSKACASNFTELGHDPNPAISRPAFQPGSGNWEAHSQEGTIAPSAITSATLSNAINHSLAESPLDHPRLTCNGTSTSATDTALPLPADEAHNLCPPPSPSPSPSPSPPPQMQENFPCATNRADEEAASSADENEVMFTGMDVPDVDYHVEDPLDHRNNSILDMIPWPDYVLMDGLDLSCETPSTTGVYPAFEFSAEAMDRDSEHYLSDDSSDFLLRLPQHSSSFQGQCELPKSSGSSTTDQLPRLPVSPPVDDQSPGAMDSDVAGECPGQADQALWSSMDLAPLCMVA